MGLILLSCQNQANKTNAKDEKIKLQLNGLSEEHPNKETMEWLLNNYKEEFIVSKEDWSTIENGNLIQKGYKFHAKLSNVSLILIFCKNQQDALTIGETNGFLNDTLHMCGVNGSVLFVAQGNDQYEVNSVLQWFAGEE